MLKLLAWKIGFEVANVKAAWVLRLGLKEPVVHYFTFGANLDPVTLAARKIHPLMSRDFVLENHTIVFDHPGPWRGMGFASIQAAPGKAVYGKLLTLKQSEARRLDYFEAVDWLNRYARRYFVQQQEAFYAYVSQMPRGNLKPSRDYLDKIIRGLDHCRHVPESYRNELRATVTLEHLEIADDLHFCFKPHPWFRESWRVRCDQIAVYIYLNVFRRYWLTEWLL